MIDLDFDFMLCLGVCLRGQLCFCWKIKKVIATCNFLFTIQPFFLKFISPNSELKSRNYEFISCNSNAFSELWDINSELWDINLQRPWQFCFVPQQNKNNIKNNKLFLSNNSMFTSHNFRLSSKTCLYLQFWVISILILYLAILTYFLRIMGKKIRIAKFSFNFSPTSRNSVFPHHRIKKWKKKLTILTFFSTTMSLYLTILTSQNCEKIDKKSQLLFQHSINNTKIFHSCLSFLRDIKVEYSRCDMKDLHNITSNRLI